MAGTAIFSILRFLDDLECVVRTEEKASAQSMLGYAARRGVNSVVAYGKGPQHDAEALSRPET
jgi:hypothetical protein